MRVLVKVNDFSRRGFFVRVLVRGLIYKRVNSGVFLVCRIVIS